MIDNAAVQVVNTATDRHGATTFRHHSAASTRRSVARHAAEYVLVPSHNPLTVQNIGIQFTACDVMQFGAEDKHKIVPCTAPTVQILPNCRHVLVFWQKLSDNELV